MSSEGATREQNPLKLAGSGFAKSQKIKAGHGLEIGLYHSVTHEVAGSSPVVPAISLADRSRPDRLPVVNPAEV